MVCNKKRVIVSLAFASTWVLMTFFYFTITGSHFQLKSSVVQNTPSRKNAFYTVSMAAKYQTETNNTEEVYANETVRQLIDFKDLGKKKRKVLLLLIVSTAPARFERRQAIRETWWKQCSDRQVKCVFMTDGLIKDRIQRNLIFKEKDEYKDVELQLLKGGREFGLRFLNQIKWAMAKFNFQYLLRIDDDYFLCLKRLLSELPLRPKINLVWGFFHCEAGITWMDEAFMVFSKDIIQKFLAQNESSMMCHPHADQQVMLWLNDIRNKIYFHDTRLHHQPPASLVPRFSNITNFCDSYLGAHGAFVKMMRYLGLRANDSAKGVSAIPEYSRFCRNTKFDFHAFNPMWRYEPKPCKGNPTWGLKDKMWFGKELGQGT